MLSHRILDVRRVALEHRILDYQIILLDEVGLAPRPVQAALNRWWPVGRVLLELLIYSELRHPHILIRLDLLIQHSLATCDGSLGSSIVRVDEKMRILILIILKIIAVQLIAIQFLPLLQVLHQFILKLSAIFDLFHL